MPDYSQHEIMDTLACLCALHDKAMKVSADLAELQRDLFYLLQELKQQVERDMT